jgi:hypothetical protein
MIRRTVEAIAAGTFAMIDITGFRLRVMKTYLRDSAILRAEKMC